MLNQNGTFIVVHGMHPAARAWAHNIWGDPANGQLGRLTKGLWLFAHEEKARLFLAGGGRGEAGAAQTHLFTHWNEVMQSPLFQHIDQDRVRDRLEKNLLIDSYSTSTAEEIRTAAGVALQYEPDTFVLVTSPSHGPRVLREAVATLAADPRFTRLRLGLRVVPSDIYFEGYGESDTIILEPPHHAQPHEEEFHSAMKRALEEARRDPRRKKSFETLLRQFADRHY